MGQIAIQAAKEQIENLLKDYLREEGIELLTPPDVQKNDKSPLVMLEGIEHLQLEGSLLQWEIRVILGVFGKKWQCRKLIDGIYRALNAYRPTAAELTALLTSLHVEVTHFARTRNVSKRTTIRYVLGET